MYTHVHTCTHVYTYTPARTHNTYTRKLAKFTFLLLQCFLCCCLLYLLLFVVFAVILLFLLIKLSFPSTVWFYYLFGLIIQGGCDEKIVNFSTIICLVNTCDLSQSATVRWYNILPVFKCSIFQLDFQSLSYTKCLIMNQTLNSFSILPNHKVQYSVYGLKRVNI